MTDRPDTRLFVEDRLAAGTRIVLGRGQTHYLANVLRLGPGAVVALFNGRHGEWQARIESLRKGGGIVAVETLCREQHREPDLWLVFAPVKRVPLAFIVQKATELGVSELIPVVTRRTVVGRIKRERMEATAIEAAEQSERLTVPRVRDAEPMMRVFDAWPTGRPLLLCAESGPAEPIQDALRQLETDTPGAILIGPEGGFEETELDALRKLPFVTAVGLGPRILRADTAALAALACWQSALGDWRLKPDGRMHETANGRD
ncbi:MAG: 16S rRNA (uracil(1498)-N(3))-methyltransferase [Rhodospirillales bacterium]|nr:MAG: 16S rRNA (uracil(1498)-N(3))-methyltransferase [Rhodospirillales bacterium]